MRRAPLGSSAAVDAKGRLWVVYTEPAGSDAHVQLIRSDDLGRTWQQPIRVTSAAEPVAADGENRPKLAVAPGGTLYVTWTSPTSEQFTGDIRFTRSMDGGKTWSAPTTVHHDSQRISHRFESLVVDSHGTVWVIWLDKRDVEAAKKRGEPYDGAAVYYSRSDDGGTTWKREEKLADESCECCRIATALDIDGRPLVFWRHVFEPNERDHALAKLGGPQPAKSMHRATFDRWRVDACPHHGPGLAVAEDGRRHAVWFNVTDQEGRAYYGQLTSGKPEAVRQLPQGATHADVLTAGDRVAVVWRRFDGKANRVESWISSDRGQTFTSGPTLISTAHSDQPRLVRMGDRMLVVWRTAERIEVREIAATSRASSDADPAGATAGAAPFRASGIRQFGADTLAGIEAHRRGEPFWLVLWDLECVYCMQSLTNIAALQRMGTTLQVVTVATDPMSAAAQIAARLAEIGVDSEAYAFDDSALPDALRHAIDPDWAGEKPRAYYYYAEDGRRRAISGVLKEAVLAMPR